MIAAPNHGDSEDQEFPGHGPEDGLGAPGALDGQSRAGGGPQDRPLAARQVPQGDGARGPASAPELRLDARQQLRGQGEVI